MGIGPLGHDITNFESISQEEAPVRQWRLTPPGPPENLEGSATHIDT